MSNYNPISSYESANTGNTLGRLYGYQVIGSDGDDIGKIDNLWMDDGGRQGFVAITTGWLFGRQCLIPSESLEVDDPGRKARIPYSKDFVKNSPNVAEDYEVTTEEGRQVREYYGMNTAGVARASSRDRVAQDDILRDDGGIVSDVTAKARTSNNAVTGDVEYEARPSRTDGDTTEIQLAEEQVNVGKREVESGRVRLRKVVRTETVMQPVELSHEDVIIERVEASGKVTGNEFTEDSVEIPLMREEAVVEKTTNVTGAVRVRKTSEAEQQNVSTTIRKEDVEVDRDVELDKGRAKKDNGSGSGSKSDNG